MGDVLVSGSYLEQWGHALNEGFSKGHRLSLPFEEIDEMHYVSRCCDCSATVTLYNSAIDGQIVEDEVHKAGDALFMPCPVMDPAKKYALTVEFLRKQRALLTGRAQWKPDR